MKTLVSALGAEHALALALSRDPSVKEVHAAPGNPGMAGVATLHPLDVLDGDAVAALATSLGVDLVVVGRRRRSSPVSPMRSGSPEPPASGPRRTRLGWRVQGVRQGRGGRGRGADGAASRVCATAAEAAAALDEFGAPYVVKDDGLAAGKGVVVTSDRDEALATPRRRPGRHRGIPGRTGSVPVRAHRRQRRLPAAAGTDFKQIFDGDEGPNTGGTGAYTPLPWAPPGLVSEVLERVLQPTVDEIARRGSAFSALLCAGLALTSRGCAWSS